MGLGKRRDMKISQGLASGMRSEHIRETDPGTDSVIDGASAAAYGRNHVGTILQGNVLECQRCCAGLRPTARLFGRTFAMVGVSSHSAPTAAMWTRMQEWQGLAHRPSLIRMRSGLSWGSIVSRFATAGRRRKVATPI